MTAFNELPEPDRDLARSLQTSLRASEDLDFVTASRLRAVRARVLDDASRPARGWLFASGGLTAAAIVAVLLVLRAPQPTRPLSPETSASSQTEALDILTDDVDADFYEDLDLYRWLDRNHDGNA